MYEPVLLCINGFYDVLLFFLRCFTGFYWPLLAITGIHHLLLVLIEFELLVVALFYYVLLVLTEFTLFYWS